MSNLDSKYAGLVNAVLAAPEVYLQFVWIWANCLLFKFCYNLHSPCSQNTKNKKKKTQKQKKRDLIELMAYQTSVSVAPYALELISALLKLGFGEANFEEGLALEYVLSL